jgi:hypothetical protein
VRAVRWIAFVAWAIVAIVLLLISFFAPPIFYHPVQLLGQIAAAIFIGWVIGLIVYVIGALIVKVARKKA